MIVLGCICCWIKRSEAKVAAAGVLINL